MADSVYTVSSPTKTGMIVSNPDGTNVGASTVDQSTFTSSSTTGTIMEGVYQSSPDTVASGKAAAIGIDANRNVKTNIATAFTATIDTITSKLSTDAIMNDTVALTPKFAAIAASTSGNNTIVAAVTGKKIRVLAYSVSASGAVNWKWQSGAGGTDITGLTYGATNTLDKAAFNPVGHFETAATTLLNLNLSGATAVGGYVVYIEV